MFNQFKNNLLVLLGLSTTTQNVSTTFDLALVSALLFHSDTLSFSVIFIQIIGSGMGLCCSLNHLTLFSEIGNSFNLLVGLNSWPSLNFSTISASVSGPITSLILISPIILKNSLLLNIVQSLTNKNQKYE